jgi:hypothetical protein
LSFGECLEIADCQPAHSFSHFSHLYDNPKHSISTSALVEANPRFGELTGLGF